MRYSTVLYQLHCKCACTGRWRADRTSGLTSVFFRSQIRHAFRSKQQVSLDSWCLYLTSARYSKCICSARWLFAQLCASCSGAAEGYEQAPGKVLSLEEYVRLKGRGRAIVTHATSGRRLAIARAHL